MVKQKPSHPVDILGSKWFEVEKLMQTDIPITVIEKKPIAYAA